MDMFAKDLSVNKHYKPDSAFQMEGFFKLRT